MGVNYLPYKMLILQNVDTDMSVCIYLYINVLIAFNTTTTSGGTGRFLREYEAVPEVQALRARGRRKQRGVAAATAKALASLGAL